MRIAIDAGHGGYDSGAVAPDGTKEKDIALQYAKDLAVILKDIGHEVMLTRVNDDFVGLTLRANRADDWNADALISLHANAAGNTAAHGAWIIYDDRTAVDKGIALAEAIFNELLHVPDITDEDPEAEIYPDGSPWVGGRQLAVISKTKCPAVLVELGFLTNPEDLEDLLTDDIRTRVCKAIARGVSYWGGDSLGGTRLEDEEPRVEDTHRRPLEGSGPLRLVEAWHRPVREVARPEQSTAGFIRETLTPLLVYLGPTAAKIWRIILDKLLERIEEEVDRRL